jgi:hypothetical protein
MIHYHITIYQFSPYVTHLTLQLYLLSQTLSTLNKYFSSPD